MLDRDGTTLVQAWEGYGSLVKENNGWTLNEADLEKVSSRGTCNERF